MSFKKGDFVYLRQSGTGVVVGTDEDADVPRGHLVVWFGHSGPRSRPEVWTLPTEQFRAAPEPLRKG